MSGVCLPQKQTNTKTETKINKQKDKEKSYLAGFLPAVLPNAVA